MGKIEPAVAGIFNSYWSGIAFQAPKTVFGSWTGGGESKWWGWGIRVQLEELGVQLVRFSEWSGTVPIFSGSYQLRDLADVPDVVQRPFVEHLGKRDLPDFRVFRPPVSRAGRQVPQEFDIALALLFEMIEGGFGVGISIECEMHLRVV